MKMAEKEIPTASLHEQPADIEQFGEIAHERHEAIHDAMERAERKQKTRHSEREVLAEAQQLAEKLEGTNKKDKAPPQAERRHGPITKRQLNSSFKSQMSYAENEMTRTERLTSRTLHNRVVEKTADFVGSTVARPNAMLSGSIAAFIGITLLYFLAKYYGFQLSGFETLGAFIVGWIIGILYDYFSAMIRGHR